MKVLLCDDHLLFVQALADALADRGHDVTVTTSPADAVEAARREPPDVCVLDRMFPSGDDGVEALRAVLAVAPDTRVLMLTGSPDAATARGAVAAGARGFLKKDEPLDHILEALDQVAEGLLVVDVNVLRPEARATRSPAHTGLTVREQEVLERMVNGQSGQGMADEMGVSYSTMRTHVQSVLTKLNVHSQLEATAYAVQHGLVRARVG